MKKIMLIAICSILCMVSLTGCNIRSAKSTEKQKVENQMMIVVDETGDYVIYAHKETGVMYFSRDTIHGTSICVMVDAEGKPLIFRAEDYE